MIYDLLQLNDKGIEDRIGYKDKVKRSPGSHIDHP